MLIQPNIYAIPMMSLLDTFTDSWSLYLPTRLVDCCMVGQLNYYRRCI